MSFFQIRETEAMQAAREAAERLHKDSISLTAQEGELIALLVALSGAERFVEIGTLTGYSSCWIQGALPPHGQLWTIEKDPTHADAARKTFQKFQGARVELLEGDARDKLTELTGPFDGVFIDGNKGAYWDYLQWAESHIKKGGLIILDNIFLGGALTDPNYQGKFSKAVIARMKKLVERVQDPNLYKMHCFESRDGLIALKKLF